MQPLDLAKLLNVPKLDTYLDEVQHELESILTTDNLSLRDPFQRLTSKSGKRLRASILIAVVSSQNAKIDKSVIRACAAIELVHLGSLVHDDIIDHADSRRGQPTVNAEEGVNMAIIVGDYLLAKACEEAATVNLDMARIIASTISRLCDGESKELASLHDLGRSVDSYLEATAGKSGALIAAACEIGGLCADLPNAQINSLSKYGQSLGIAFQLIDDVMDLISTEELMGKPVGSDIPEGIYTLPLLLGLKGAQSAKIKKSLKKSTITDVLLNDGSITRTIAEARKYCALSAESVRKIDNKYLAQLPEAYLDWVLNNLVAEKYTNRI